MNAEESQWVKSTATELNNLLQVISESAQLMDGLPQQSEESKKHINIVRSSADRATAVTNLMLARVAESMPEQEESVPAMAPGAPVVTDRGDPIEIANPEGKRELIMIVDDEPFVTMLAERVLTDEGYRVITAKDGFNCLDIYRKLQKEISLVILDFTMPIMDGSEVFEELCEINPKVSVVISSGFAEQDQLRGGLAKGLRGFIPKPYTQQKLLQQVRSTLDSVKDEA